MFKCFQIKNKSTHTSILKLLLFLLRISLVFTSYINTLGGNQLLLDISGLTQTPAGNSVPISNWQFPSRRKRPTRPAFVLMAGTTGACSRQVLKQSLCHLPILLLGQKQHGSVCACRWMPLEDTSSERNWLLLICPTSQQAPLDKHFNS